MRAEILATVQLPARPHRVVIITALAGAVLSVFIKEGLPAIETFRYAGTSVWFAFWLERLLAQGGAGLAVIYLPAGLAAVLAWLFRRPSPRKWFDAITMVFFTLYLVALVGTWIGPIEKG